MSDSLRDRIAAVIYNTSDEYARKLLVRPDCPGASEVEGSGKPVCYVLADALIRELKFRRLLLETEDGRRFHCYNTEWEALPDNTFNGKQHGPSQ